MTANDRLSLLFLALALGACRAGETASSPDRAWHEGAQPDVSSPAASAPVEPEVLAVRTMPRTAEHARMEDAAGRYVVQGSFYPRPDCDARQVEGELEAWWNDQTMSLEGSFTGTLWNQPFVFVSEMGFDPTLGCWVETWRDEEGQVLRPLAHGFEEGAGCIVTMRSESGRTVRDEIHLDGGQMQRRIWRMSAEGRPYLSLELVGRRVD